MTLEEIGGMLNLTRERVRQMKEKPPGDRDMHQEAVHQDPPGGGSIRKAT